ncbi:MAG: WD40 repeat domain-containing protein [Symploca sp. SIO2E9]|nr:WD40 repeat domain-containing protein [Symploca sp. SIO2E9]
MTFFAHSSQLGKIQLTVLASVTVAVAGLTSIARAQDSLPVPVPPVPTETPSQENFDSDFIPAASLWSNPQLVQILEGHEAPIDALLFSADGEMLLSGGSTNDGNIKLWRLQTGKEIDSFRGHRTSVIALTLSPDGKTLASAGDDAGINLWNWPGGKYTRTFLGHSSNILSLVMTPDSKTLISGGLDGIRLWDLIAQRPLYTLTRFDNQTYALAVHPDGDILVSGLRDGSIKRWNLGTGSLIQTIPVHTSAVSVLAFTPDGNTMVSGSYDRTIKVWDLSRNRLELRYSLTGHAGRIRAIAINPDGTTLASASRDGVRLWNLKTGELIAFLGDHQDWVHSVAFSRDGRFLASGGFDRTIRIWQTASGEFEPLLEGRRQ